MHVGPAVLLLVVACGWAWVWQRQPLWTGRCLLVQPALLAQPLHLFDGSCASIHAAV